MFVDIQITGPASCGKTVLAEKLEALLREHLPAGARAQCRSSQEGFYAAEERYESEEDFNFRQGA